jgi:hypothetical protein
VGKKNIKGLKYPKTAPFGLIMPDFAVFFAFPEQKLPLFALISQIHVQMCNKTETSKDSSL